MGFQVSPVWTVSVLVVALGAALGLSAGPTGGSPRRQARDLPPPREVLPRVAAPEWGQARAWHLPQLPPTSCGQNFTCFTKVDPALFFQREQNVIKIEFPKQNNTESDFQS